MFKGILVPVSRVREVENALEVAVDLADPRRGSVTLLHVVELVRDMPLAEHEAFYRTLERQAETDLGAARLRYLEQGVDLRTRVTFGHRVRDILESAVTLRSDLIVLQSHPVDPADPAATWGTISYRVAVLARCPVMLVK